MKFTANQILAFIIFIVPSIVRAAPYLRPDDVECCLEEPNNLDFENLEPIIQDNENLLYIPFTETTIRDFGIHKYVVNRNIKTLMSYHTDSQLMNIVGRSLNKSTLEITNLVMKNIDEFNAMDDNEFISNFMDFWVAYRLVQFSEFSSDNLELFANMFRDTPNSRNNTEL